MPKLLRVMFIAAVIVGAAGFIVFILSGDDDAVSPTEITTQPSETAETEKQIELPPESTEPELPMVFEPAQLQAALDTWVVGLPAGSSASVVIADIDGSTIASINPDQVYFAASIYKLYVAYAGYQQVDEKAVDPSELYVAGNTRAECLDLMIRESDSPCAETLWNELGKQELTDDLESYGITNTDMVMINTTATDASKMLSRIALANGLSTASQAAYLDSMNDQPETYRRGLPSGFSDEVTVYNKVGWNLSNEWHDVAIIELQDGRQAIISVLTENVGISRMSELGSLIEEQILTE